MGQRLDRDILPRPEAGYSLRKAHSVQSEVPGDEGLTRVSAVAAVRFERRRVKSVNAGSAGRSINERIGDSAGGAPRRLPGCHLTRNVIYNPYTFWS